MFIKTAACSLFYQRGVKSYISNANIFNLVNPKCRQTGLHQYLIILFDVKQLEIFVIIGALIKWEVRTIFVSSFTVLCGAVVCIKTCMEGCNEEGESQEVHVGIHKDSFNLISFLFCETCNT